MELAHSNVQKEKINSQVMLFTDHTFHFDIIVAFEHLRFTDKLISLPLFLLLSFSVGNSSKSPGSFTVSVSYKDPSLSNVVSTITCVLQHEQLKRESDESMAKMRRDGERCEEEARALMLKAEMGRLQAEEEAKNLSEQMQEMQKKWEVKVCGIITANLP